MAPQRRGESVEARAERILDECRISSAPVDVEHIASKLGISVESTDFGQDDCSGVLVRQGETAVIGVNRLHHRNRKRFTIAHEIGHFVLHESGTYIDKGTFVNFRDAESGTGTRSEEIEANRFAAALLMPEKWVKRAFAETQFDPADDETLRTLAERFSVSSTAMSVRLATLRLIDPA